MAEYQTSALNPWNFVKSLPPELEREAARGLLDFLDELDGRLAEALATEDAAVLEDLHEVYGFERFKPEWLDYILPAIGRGDVQIELHGGLVKMEETGIPALWRMQMGTNDSFILGRVPLCVRREAEKGEERIGRIVNNNADVFAAPAIIEELNEGLAHVDWRTLPEDPVFMVELNRQPLGPGDAKALLSTLGRGEVECRIAGFCQARIVRTNVRGLWHSKLLNNAGRELLDAYVCAAIPPEVAAPKESFADAREKIAEMREWIERDLTRTEEKKSEVRDDVLDYAKRLMEGL